jgi:hypothetical protein
MCALLGRAEEARSHFDAARRQIGGKPADPRVAILDFDEAIATRICRGLGPERRAALLEAAADGFRRNGMAGWLRRAAREREAVA